MRSVWKYHGVTYVWFMIGIASAPGFAPTQRAPRLSARSYGSVNDAAAFSTPGICRMRESDASKN